jgi:hypothetical protein
MTTVKGVQPAELGNVWGRVAPLIERGLSRGCGFAIDDVHASLEAGRRQLFVTWPGLDCALVTEDIAYPRERVLHVFLLAGRLPGDWRQILGGLEAWAASRGCRAIELRGRRGWTRKLAGYAAPAVIMRKELAA